ncbi:HAD hydrolase-like protein [Bradyrhizobium sp.]|uniref:HAD hydrolase-like protein n=1 Tax=Bradyrhizobium sp. TaxID=376 RepID=UPI004037E081
MGIIAISNGAAAVTKALLERANLMPFVDHIVSVDEVKVSKPRKDVYLHAARIATVDARELALVATHAWDVHGARAAGLMAGFVARGQRFPKTMNAPDVIGESLNEVARLFTVLNEAGASA